MFNLPAASFSFSIWSAFSPAVFFFFIKASRPSFCVRKPRISSASSSQSPAASSASFFCSSASVTFGTNTLSCSCFASRFFFIFCFCCASPSPRLAAFISLSRPFMWSFTSLKLSSCRFIASTRSWIPRMVFPSNFAFFSSFHSASAWGSSLINASPKYWRMLKRMPSYSFHFPFTASRSRFSIS